jgi:hypothetical protein
MDTHSDSSNVTKYNKLDATKMIEYASKSHYILFWPTTGYAHRHRDLSMSGSFPLGYSVGTQLLVPESFVEPLGLKGLASIPDGGGKQLEKPTDEEYSVFMTERIELIKRRDGLFSSTLEL